MLFHVLMKVVVPPGTEAATLERLGREEHERAAELQRQGTWLHLWRIVGQFSNVSVFRVDSGEELHAILESLPLHPFMTVEVTALCRHPGAVATAD
jgi:muconolactone D-isomerase